MQAEMNDWMPQDTAAMYENLLKQLSRNRKKVWGRDIFNNKSLSFEPNMNMALPRNYRIGPGDAVFIDVYGASQSLTRQRLPLMVTSPWRVSVLFR